MFCVMKYFLCNNFFFNYYINIFFTLQAEEKRIENYENFLKEQKVLKRKATWCDFPEAVQSSNNTSNNNGPEETVKKSKKKKKNSEQTNTEVNVNSEVNDGIKSKKKKNKAENITDQPTNTENPDIGESSQNTKKNKKKNKKLKKSQENEASSNHQPDNTQNAVEANPQRNNKKVINQKQQTQKKKKDISGKHMRRKEVNDRSFKLIINGKDVELVRYDGFPVMKKDAERIEELKSNMLKKGIPKSEVQRTIKLERRRAEKALARVKRDVCYNCRKGGHVLSDCPELKSIIPGGNEADGVCFKCGSTEHRQFECKVQKDNEFRFATCFICREPVSIVFFNLLFVFFIVETSTTYELIQLQKGIVS